MATINPVAFIFDVDETLLDNDYDATGAGYHERLRHESVKDVAHQRNITELFDVTMQDNIDAFVQAPVHTFEAALWNLFCMKGVRDWPIDPNDELLNDITRQKDKKYYDILRSTVRCVPDADSFVRAAHTLTNGNLAIASSAKRHDIDAFLDTQNLQQYFASDRIISIENTSMPKPNPESFDKAFRSLRLPDESRSRVVAVEDSPRGIVSAKAAGLFTCAITTVYSRERHMAQAIQPDLIVESYAELAETIGTTLK